MYAFGRARADRIIDNNEDGGRAANNPYASPLYRRFTLPLAEAIKKDLDQKRPGKAKAHVSLLAPLDPEGIAFLAVRGLLNTLLNPSERQGQRAVVGSIGRAVYHELILRLFEGINPALFYTLTNDLDRRMSKDEHHRIRTFKTEAKKDGIEFPEWGSAGVTQVGAYLVNALEGLGMVKTTHTQSALGGRCRAGIDITLTDDVMQLIGSIREMVRETMPYFLPCVEQPIDWTRIDAGGWHTNEMRRMQPFAVAARGAWSEVGEQDISIPLRAINTLQSVRWQINGRLLDTVKLVSKHYDMEEVLAQAETPAPPRPAFLEQVNDASAMSEGQLAEFTAWKREKREWHTSIKVRGTKASRFATAMRVSEEFREYPAIHFVYFADFRGRLYAQTTGVSPQGSDLQKALLRFSDGKPLDSMGAELWFLCHGANRWGYDKVSLEDRAKWVRDHHKLIMDFAADPVANAGWMEADKPLQFLAWALEYADWSTSPDTFVSHIPIGMDGSCNGLQNFSAMLRDEVGGKATNLVPGHLPRDIYHQVAEVAAHLLRRTEADEAGFRDKWLAHGLNRTLVKRSVMTQPYGSTRFSCSNFIVDDYLRAGKAPEFAKEEYSKAASYLSHFVWDAIGEVVIKAREAMNWLQKAAGEIISGGADEIRWVTPSGFPVVQRYQKVASHRIRTTLCGNAFLRLGIEQEDADRAKHKNGISPNFIHSYDASHLQLATVAAGAEGMALAMIHDDYGTHAADAPRLATIIRETFVAMYEDISPLEELAARYGLTPPPQLGSLQLRDVLTSTYFFA